MALSARLQVRQTQSLIITPQLMQAIRLLQMSGVELERFVAEELEQNPLLDADESPASDTPDSGGEPQADAAPASADIEADAADVFSGPIGLDSDAARAQLARGAGSTGAPLDDIGLDQRLPATESLEAMLGRTIDTVFAAAPVERAIALALLSELDEAGYLTAEPAAIASRLGASPMLVERVLGACQDLAPTGVFARSLAECLELQLAERNRLTQPMQTLLANLPRLAAGDRASLAALCGVGRDGLEKLVAEIRALDPKPGLAFTHEPIRALIPDVFVRAAPNNSWIVELNEDVLPRLLVNRAYYAQ